jgi:hypothetical protein
MAKRPKGWMGKLCRIIRHLGSGIMRGWSRHSPSQLNAGRVKYWEIIGDNLNNAGWSWGCVAAIDSSGRTIWIVDAHRDDRKRFVVHAG